MTTALAIGTAAGSTVAFSAMGTPVTEPAKLVFYPYAEVVRTLAGTDQTRGAARVEMLWTSIPRAMRDQLRAYLPNASGTIYANLPTNESAGSFDIFEGIYHWPLKEPWKRGAAGDIIADFQISITHLVTA